MVGFHRGAVFVLRTALMQNIKPRMDQPVRRFVSTAVAVVLGLIAARYLLLDYRTTAKPKANATVEATPAAARAVMHSRPTITRREGTDEAISTRTKSVSMATSRDTSAPQIRVRGQVSGTDGRPLSGTLLTLRAGQVEPSRVLASALSNQRGSFTLPAVAKQERFSLTARLKGYAPEEHVLTPEDASRYEEQFVLTLSAPLSGRVVDATTSVPIGDAVVHHPVRQGSDPNNSETANTSPLGTFAFDDVSSGQVLLLVEKPGYQRQLAAVDAPGDCQVALWRGGCTVSGKLVGGPAENMANYDVILMSEQTGFLLHQAPVGDSFEFTAVPPGTWNLYAAGEVPSRSIEFLLSPNEQKSDIELQLPRDVLVSGICLERGTGTAISGVHVQPAAQNESEAVESGADGRFTLHGLSPDSGEIRLAFRKTGYAMVDDKEPGQLHFQSGEIVVPVVSGAAGNVKAQFAKANALSGRVLNPDQSPAIHVAVTLRAHMDRENRNQSSQIHTDETGEFYFNLPDDVEGYGYIGASREGAFGVESTVLHRKDEVVVRLDDSEYRGLVKLSDGLPLSDVRVSGYYPTTLSHDRSWRLDADETETSLDGSFVLHGLKAGRDQLELQLPSDATFQVNLKGKQPAVFVFNPVVGSFEQQD